MERERATHIIVAQLREEIAKLKQKIQDEIDYRETLVVDLRDEIKRQEANVQALLRDIEDYEERIAKLKKEKVEIEEKCNAKLDKHEQSWLKKH